MFGTIRKHQNWLWYIIIAVIIVSFVVFFSPYNRVRDGGGKADLGKINGRDITLGEWQSSLRETHLFHFLRYKDWPGNSDAARQTGFDVERETYNRLLLIDQIRALNIQVSPAATAKWITQVMGASEDQPFDVRGYEQFIDKTFRPHGISAADFEQFATHEVGRQHLIALHGQTGRMLPPQEAEFLYRRENQPFDTQIVLFAASNYLAKVQSTPATLAQFYTNNMAAYFLPDRLQVQFVRYDTTNFMVKDDVVFARLKEANPELARATNYNQILDAYYFNRGTNFYKDSEGKPFPIEIARAQIQEEFRQREAETSARREAAKFINELFELRKQPGSTNALEKLAAAKGFKVGLTAPFDVRTGPRDLAIPPAQAQSTFALTPEEPYLPSSLVGSNAVFVVGLKRQIPRELQSIEAVKAKLTEDFKEAESIKLMRTDGERVANLVTNGLAQGKSFEALCTEAGVKTVKLAPFSQSTRLMPELEGKVSFGFVQNVTAGLEPGKASSFRALSEAGFIVFLRAKLPVDEAKMKTDLPDFMSRLRDQRQMAAFAEWFQIQALQIQRPMASATPPKTKTGARP